MRRNERGGAERKDKRKMNYIKGEETKLYSKKVGDEIK